ncbi:MAG: hypothetical protein QOG43_1501 [Actinomycetota bacterium]|nr:hypothetical protein [Actinomycetota bacterium]
MRLPRDRWRRLAGLTMVGVMALVGVPAAVLALQGPAGGFVEICKAAEGPTVTGVFRFSVGGVTTDVPVGACSPVIAVPAGTVTIIEAERPGISVSGVQTLPVSRLVSSDPATRTARVQVVAGDESTQTTVTFTNRSELAILKICKVAGPGVAVGTNVAFTAGTVAVTVPAGPPPGGTCAVAGWFPVATNVAVTESIPDGTEVSSITVAPADRLVGSPNLSGGSVVVRIGSGVVEATFTNRVPPPSAATTTTTTVGATATTTTTSPAAVTTTSPGGATTTTPGASTTAPPGVGATTTVGGFGVTTTSPPGVGVTTTTTGGGAGVTTTQPGAGATTTTVGGGGGGTTTTLGGGGGGVTTTTVAAGGATTTVGPGGAATTTTAGPTLAATTTVAGGTTATPTTTTIPCVAVTTPTPAGPAPSTTTVPAGETSTTTTAPAGGSSTTTTTPAGGSSTTTTSFPGGGGPSPSTTTSFPGAGGPSPSTTTTVAPASPGPTVMPRECLPGPSGPQPGPVVVVRAPGSASAPAPSGVLATTGKRIAPLVLLGCLALVVGGLLVQADPRTMWATAGLYLAGALERRPARRRPALARPPHPSPVPAAGQAPGGPDGEADGADGDPFPALTFVPVVVDDDPAENVVPLQAWESAVLPEPGAGGRGPGPA